MRRSQGGSKEQQLEERQGKERGGSQGHRKIGLTCFVNQALGLLLHPFLVIVLHVLLVLPATAVGFSHGGLGKVTETLKLLDIWYDFKHR